MSPLGQGHISFLHRVNDQVQNRKNQSSKDATEDSEEHSVRWGMFMSSTLRASVFTWRRITQTIGILSKIQKISQ